jgi:hypothetical protein
VSLAERDEERYAGGTLGGVLRESPRDSAVLAGSSSITSWQILFGYVGQGAIEYQTFTQSCGVEPDPNEIDYSNFYSDSSPKSRRRPLQEG